MINLLPPDQKKQLSSARVNVLLLRYNLLIGGAFLFLVIAVGVAYVFVANEKTATQEVIDTNLAKEAEFSAVKLQTQTIRTQLSSARSILDSNVRYSKATARIANLLPNGTALDSLKLDPTSFTTPQNLVVRISGEEAATSLMSSLQKSPYVTSAVRGKISTAQGADSAYAYTMEVTVTFSKEIAR